MNGNVRLETKHNTLDRVCVCVCVCACTADNRIACTMYHDSRTHSACALATATQHDILIILSIADYPTDE